MAYFSYKTESGELIQISDYEIVLVDELSVSQNPLPKIALETEYTWSTELRDFFVKEKRKLTKLEFLRKFTAPERIAIRQVAVTDPIVFDAMELLDLAEFVSLDDPDTQNLIGYLSILGVLQQNRVMEILT